MVIGHRSNFVSAIFFIDCTITTSPRPVESVTIRNGGGHNGSRKLPVQNNNHIFFFIKNAVGYTTSSSGGYPKKQCFLVSLTGSAGCVLSGSEQCCYRTFNLRTRHLPDVLLNFRSSEAHLVGHP
jgi:hypothetical protein